MNGILLITPPLTQLNTPYPATVFLKGFLSSQGIDCEQLDLSIETINRVFTKKTLGEWFDQAERMPQKSKAIKRMFSLKSEYLKWVEPVVNYLQGNDTTLAHQLAKGVLPQGERFAQIPDMEFLFGDAGVEDRAKFLSTLFLEDLGDFITQCIDPSFGFSRYAEHIGIKAYSFDDVKLAVETDTPFTSIMLSLLHERVEASQPKMVAISIPFHGNMVAGFKCARYLRQHFPEISISMGGGWINTELRNIIDARLFDWVHYVCLDDGERPLLQLWKHIAENEPKENLVRTFLCENETVTYFNAKEFSDFSHQDCGTPDYRGLPLHKYISVLEVANPMHRLWSDGRWNKMMVAHGCYWAGCSFCDTSLDYIKRYSQADVVELCNRMETMIEQTGQRGFHFVDEAAPPHILKKLAIEIQQRGLNVHWWANVRFEKAFNAELCQLLARSGCMAVSGGLEVASDRLLQLMNKGVSVEQVARVCNHFQQSGIMVHAYLMYGFPTQNMQETIDSLEVVRQMFALNLMQSAYWHRFAMTVHSPVGREPQKFGVKAFGLPENAFACNDLEHEDPRGAKHEKFAFGLRKSLYNFMHGQCLDFPLQDWFDFKIPPTTLPPNYIRKALKQRDEKLANQASAQCYWFGSSPLELSGKKGSKKLLFDTPAGSVTLDVEQSIGQWLQSVLAAKNWQNHKGMSYGELCENYSSLVGGDLALFQKTSEWQVITKLGFYIV